MKFDIARQPIVPAFLTLFALTVATMYGVGAQVPVAGISIGSAAMVVPTIGELLDNFQSAFPIWSQLLAGLLLLFTGMSVGHLSARYNLYSVATCVTIPLYGIIVCSIALDDHYLLEFTTAVLLALSAKNFCQAFCNGYGFDRLFRASLYLGLLVLMAPATMLLLLLLPLSVLLFRRTMREAIVGCAGLVLAPLLFCYINWGAGGSFTAPVIEAAQRSVTGAAFGFFTAQSPLPLILLSVIGALTLIAVLFFLSDIYAIGTKARFILVFYINMFLLTGVMFCSPAATPSMLALVAIPCATLLPLLLVRTHRFISQPLYLLLLAAAVIRIALQ